MRPRGSIGLGAIVAFALLVVAPAAQADTNLGTAGGLTYIVDSTSSTAAPATLSGRANCPAGTHVVGGGASPVSFTPVTSEFWLNRSRAVDGSDANKAPDDAWIGRGYNRSGEDKSLSVYAICFGGKVFYRGAEASAPAGARIKAKAVCPPDTWVTGGGASLTGSAAQAYLNTSFPADSPAPGDAPKHAWWARAFNRGGHAKHLRVVAECVKFHPIYRFYPGDPSMQRVNVKCPTGNFVTGGGGEIGGAAANGFMNGIYPFAPMSPPDRGFVFAASRTAPKQFYGVMIVCRL